MNDSPTHRILIIDDQAAIHEDYRKILGRQPASSTALGKAAAELFGDDPAKHVEWEGFELDSAFQGQEGLELVQRSLAEHKPYSVAFVDIRMPPGWDGIETVRHIWEIDPEILVVICSAYSDYSWHEMVRELGRNDRYLILKKPFDNIEVRQCAMALSERWSVSRTDVLTGLLNRRAFGSYLELEWKRSTRHDLPLACAMLDLDNFKRINDTVGHQAGDMVLQSVARLLQAKCRASDFVCRFGGEEICVLLPHANEQEGVIWAENTRREVEANPVMIGDRAVRLTVSIGVAQRLPGNDDTERLVERADQALIRAKASGRNRVISYSGIAAVDAVAAAQHSRTNPWESASLAEVMSAPVSTLASSATVAAAARFLMETNTCVVAIVNDDEKLVGLVSEVDLINALADGDAWNRPVERVMRREVVRYDEQTPLDVIGEFLASSSVPQVFIERDGRPLGAIDRRNLLRWAIAQDSADPRPAAAPSVAASAALHAPGPGNGDSIPLGSAGNSPLPLG